jgi:hypothetical protein
MATRLKVSIHGRSLGTAAGWDGDPGECIWFYDFQPNAGVELPSGDLQYDEVNGFIGIQDDNGRIIDPIDAPTFLSKIQRRQS